MVAMRRTIERMVAPLRRRVLLAIGRAVLTLVDDVRKLQVLQVQGLAAETLDGVERVQQYGLTAHPHPGAECVMLAVGGMRQHPIVVAVDDRRYRVTDLAQGEVCLYTDEDLEESGGPLHRVVLRRGRVVEVHGDEIKVVSPGAVSIRSASLTHNGVNVGATHTHGGVASGPSRTAVPG